MPNGTIAAQYASPYCSVDNTRAAKFFIQAILFSRGIPPRISLSFATSAILASILLGIWLKRYIFKDFQPVRISFISLTLHLDHLLSRGLRYSQNDYCFRYQPNQLAYLSKSFAVLVRTDESKISIFSILVQSTAYSFRVLNPLFSSASIAMTTKHSIH